MPKLRTYSKHKTSAYVSHEADALGHIHYSDEENQIWEFLYRRQIQLLEHYACEEFREGLERLQLSIDKVPQCDDVNERLSKATGWNVVPVSAVIPLGEFFDLLRNKKFPAASFIRHQDEIDYLQEPDIFHELFGHVPMLLNPACSEFMQKYGEMAKSVDKSYQRYFTRLYWFTIEFGLIQKSKGIQCYGAGILSSYQETQYALDDPRPKRIDFDLLTCLRTPFRIDQLQMVYYVLEDFDYLYHLLKDPQYLLFHIQKAMKLGDLEPLFPTDDLIE